jgi:hypothetical protein
VYAGRSKYQDGLSDLGTTNAVLGLQYAGSQQTWLYLSGAAPLRTADPFWGAGGLGRRLAAGKPHFAIGIDAGAHGHLFRDRDSSAIGVGGTLFAMPVISLRSRAATLELRSGVRHYSSRFLGASYGATLHDSDAQAAVRVTQSVELAGKARLVRASGMSYSYAGVSLTYATQSVSLWAASGRWFEDALPGTGWSIGGQVALGRDITLWSGWQHELSDPLYWNSARTTWNIGVTRALGRRRAAVAPVAVVAQDGVTFRVRASEAPGPISVGGDFNKWTPVALQRSGDYWTLTLKLPRGAYHFAFRREDGTWFVPSSSTTTVDDGFGGRSALLVVQ